MEKIIVDADVRVESFHTGEPNHNNSYYFMRYRHSNEHADIYIPTLAHFEFQATQGRILRRNNIKRLPMREWYIYGPRTHDYEITKDFVNKCYDLKLFDKFNKLKGADLIYACIAKVENMTLATNNSKDFEEYEKEINIVYPKDYELTKEQSRILC